MDKISKNQKGFSAVEGLLILVIVGLVTFIGWYVWHAKQSTDKNLATPTSSIKNSSLKKPAVSSSATVTPQAFTDMIVAEVSDNNETKLEASLNSDFKAFRETDLAAAPCHGIDTTHVAIFCGSILNQDTAAQLKSVTPKVSEVTYKNGKAGKSVIYKAPNNGEPGTNYFAFKLVSQNDSWQVYDYGDFFLAQGDTAPAQVAGVRNQ